MAITIHCQCSREIKVSEALAGQPTRCPSCGRRHIVPQRDVPPPTPVQQCCRECQTALHAHAKFCHNCGLPNSESIPGVQEPQPQQTPQHVQPPHPYPASWPPAPAAYPYPQQPYPQPQGYSQHPHPGQPQPAAAPQPTNDPFGPAYGANQAYAAPPPPARPAQPARGEGAMDGPFGRAAQHQQGKRKKPSTPLGNVAMACAYMGILLGLVSIAFAVPLSHALGCGGGEVSLEQAESLLNLQKGILALIGIFAVFGMMMGFLGLFHFGHKKSGAIWGLILCFLIGAMASGATERVNERISALPAVERHHQIQPQAEEPLWFERCDDSKEVCPFSGARTPFEGDDDGDDDGDEDSDDQDDEQDM